MIPVAEVINSLKELGKAAHKFERGYLAAIVGSRTYPGSARLACHAAAVTGAGGVKALVPESLWPLLAAMPPEVMMVTLKEHAGELTHATAFESFLAATMKARAVLIGCGIGRHPATRFFIEQCLTHTRLPLVIDADGLAVLHTFPAATIAQLAKGQWILTPHGGELTELLLNFRINHVQELAEALQCVIVAKAMPTVIYSPGMTSLTNSTGNFATTTAGCGDVLAGIIAGFLAQGVTVANAAQLGLFVAGQAADDIIRQRGGYSLLASEVIDQLPITIGRLYK